MDMLHSLFPKQNKSLQIKTKKFFNFGIWLELGIHCILLGKTHYETTKMRYMKWKI